MKKNRRQTYDISSTFQSKQTATMTMIMREKCVNLFAAAQKAHIMFVTNIHETSAGRDVTSDEKIGRYQHRRLLLFLVTRLNSSTHASCKALERQNLC